MDRFVKELTQKQVEDFFRNHGFKGEVVWEPESTRVTLKRSDINEAFRSFLISDIRVLKAYGYEITEMDWKVYLKNIFGDEYMQFLNKQDIPNEFISQLTHEEIQKLIPFYYLHHFEECEALQVGTRRFKVRKHINDYVEDVIMGPCYEDGNIRFYGVKEDAFYRFMLKKFGKAYYHYWRNVEDIKAIEDITRYTKKRISEVTRKADAMFELIKD